MQESSGISNADVQKSGNTKSYFSALSSLVSVAGSEWSFAQLRLDPQAEMVEPETDIQSIVHKGIIYVISAKTPGYSI